MPYSPTSMSSATLLVAPASGGGCWSTWLSYSITSYSTTIAAAAIAAPWRATLDMVRSVLRLRTPQSLPDIEVFDHDLQAVFAPQQVGESGEMGEFARRVHMA